MSNANTITIGSFVVRNQGRPSQIGMRGTVTEVYGDVIGTGGDTLVTVATPYGETFQCYTRQLALS